MGFIFPYVQHQFVLASLYFILKWLSVSLIWTQTFALTVQLVLLWGYIMPIENELFHTALIRSAFEALHGWGQAHIIMSQIVLNSQISYSHCIATLHARLALSLLFQDNLLASSLSSGLKGYHIDCFSSLWMNPGSFICWKEEPVYEITNYKLKSNSTLPTATNLSL